MTIIAPSGAVLLVMLCNFFVNGQYSISAISFTGKFPTNHAILSGVIMNVDFLKYIDLQTVGILSTSPSVLIYGSSNCPYLGNTQTSVTLDRSILTTRLNGIVKGDVNFSLVF